MFWRLILVAVITLGLLGCGQETPKAPIDKPKYEAIWKEVTEMMVKRKGMMTRKDQNSVLKKNGVTEEDWKASCDAYGISDEIREYQRKAFESFKPSN